MSAKEPISQFVSSYGKNTTNTHHTTLLCFFFFNKFHLIKSLLCFFFNNSKSHIITSLSKSFYIFSIVLVLVFVPIIVCFLFHRSLLTSFRPQNPNSSDHLPYVSFLLLFSLIFYNRDKISVYAILVCLKISLLLCATTTVNLRKRIQFMID